MTEWKINNVDSTYLTQQGINDSTLLGKHNNGPHTPTPTLALYDHQCISPNTTASPWSFDQRRQKQHHHSNFITPTAAFETSTRSDINSQEHKQLWASRYEKSNDDNNKHYSLPTSSSLSTSTTTATNITLTATNNNNNNHLLDTFTSVPPTSLQYHPQRMFHNNEMIATHHHQHHVNNTNNNYNKDSLFCKYTANNHRSYSMDTHSLLSSYHHHPHSNSSQQRHNSIPTVQQAAVQAAAVAAAYQSHTSNHPGQLAWYSHSNTFQKSAPTPYDPFSSTSAALFKRDNDFHHETPSYESVVTSNFNSVISPTKINHMDYNIPTSSPPLSSSTHLLNRNDSILPLSLLSKDHHHPLEKNEENEKELNENNNNNSMNEINKSDKELKKRGKKTSTTNSKQQPQQLGKRRSPNGFFVFCSERRHILKQGKPNVRNTDINRQLGDDWKALTESERDWYKKKADRIRTELSNADNSAAAAAASMTLQHPAETHSFTFKHHDHSSSLTIAADDDDDDNNQTNNSHEDEEEDEDEDDIDENEGDGNEEEKELIHKDDNFSRRTSIGSTFLSSTNSLSSLSTPSQYSTSSFDSNNNNSKDNKNTTSSSSSVLNVASISGAAEANALDQALTVAISSTTTTSNTTNTDPSLLLRGDHSHYHSTKSERLKRPPNAYLLFNKEMRRQILNQNDKLTVAEISKILSETWTKLPTERKKYYINKAANLKKQHLEEHPDYVYSRRSKEELEKAGYRFRPSKKTKKNDVEHKTALAFNVSVFENENNMGNEMKDESVLQLPSLSNKRKKKSSSSSHHESRGRKKKRLTYPWAPKHPMSGFLFFAAHVRPEITLQCVNKRVGDISKAISAKWNQLTDEEKLPWLEKAKEDKARYAREIGEFNSLQKKEKEAAAAAEIEEQKRKQLLQNNDNDEELDEDSFYNMNNNSKKSSISSTTSSILSSHSNHEIDHHYQHQHATAASMPSTSSPSMKVTQPNHLGKMINANHHLNMFTNKNRSYHQQQHPQQPQQHPSHYHNQHLQDRYFKPYSRLSSALAPSRPASPTELDKDTIATVVQMINPRYNNNNNNDSLSNSSTTVTTTNATTNTTNNISSSTPSTTLNSIMHQHHHERSIGSFQLHVPATPPSPAIDTM